MTSAGKRGLSVAILVLGALLAGFRTASSAETATADVRRFDGLDVGEVSRDTTSSCQVQWTGRRAIVVLDGQLMTTWQRPPSYQSGIVRQDGYVAAGALNGWIVDDEFKGQLAKGFSQACIMRYNLRRVLLPAYPARTNYDGHYEGMAVGAPQNPAECDRTVSHVIRVQRGLAWIDNEVLGGNVTADGGLTLTSPLRKGIEVTGHIGPSSFDGVRTFRREDGQVCRWMWHLAKTNTL